MINMGIDTAGHIAKFVLAGKVEPLSNVAGTDPLHDFNGLFQWRGEVVDQIPDERKTNDQGD